MPQISALKVFSLEPGRVAFAVYRRQARDPRLFLLVLEVGGAGVKKAELCIVMCFKGCRGSTWVPQPCGDPSELRVACTLRPTRRHLTVEAGVPYREEAAAGASAQCGMLP